MVGPDHNKIEHVGHLSFAVKNNEAEYEALLAGLKIARYLGITRLTINIDSQLVVKQAKGTFIVKEPRMRMYLKEI